MQIRKYLFMLAVLICFCLPWNTPLENAEITHPLADNYITCEAGESWLWPTPSSNHITSFFGKRNISVYGYERQHTGIDINAVTGADVLAAQSGTVLVSTYDGGWGHYIIVNHGDNILTLYAHLNTRTVERGESVERGQVIGKVGNTGISTAPHLHFELREHGKPVNPFRFTYKDK